MTDVAANIEHVKKLYDSISKKDMAGLAQAFSDDLSFHVIRPMPPKTFEGRTELLTYLAEVSKAAPQDADIDLEQIGGDQDYVMVIHREAKGTPREHRHVMIYRLDEGSIQEGWELTLGGEPDTSVLNHAEPVMAELTGKS